MTKAFLTVTWAQIKGTNWADQGISYCDLGPDKRNELGGWVDGKFASNIGS
jgi:hypothetical protein